MLIMKVQVADSQYRFAWRMAGATGSFPEVEKNQPTHTLLGHYYHTNATVVIKRLHTVDI